MVYVDAYDILYIYIHTSLTINYYQPLIDHQLLSTYEAVNGSFELINLFRYHQPLISY